MTQSQSAGEEFLRLFHPEARALVSYRDDGTVHAMGPFGRWRHIGTRKASIPLSDWIERKRAAAQDFPAWCREITELPSQQQLNEWSNDSVCETPTGHIVEPDGTGPDGVPSWLRCLGLI